MKTLVGLLPLAVGLTIAGVVIWQLLARGMTAGAWLLAGLLVGHGLIHGLFLVPRPQPAASASAGGEWPFDMARSWLVTTAGLDLSLVRIIGIALIAVVVVGFVLGGLSTVGLLIPAGWWPGLVVGSAAASILLFVMFFDAQLLLGVAIDAVLLWVVFGSIWSPTAA